MPLYTYECDDHGGFAAWGPMSESDAPRPCPACEEPAPRALARPAVGGRGEAADEGGACGMGACGPAAMPSMGACCGGGGCAH